MHVSNKFRKVKLKSKKTVDEGVEESFRRIEKLKAEKTIRLAQFPGFHAEKKTYHSRCDARAAWRQDPEACEHGSGSDIILLGQRFSMGTRFADRDGGRT